MNIDDLTIGQARQLAEIFGTKTDQQPSAQVGKKCIIRCYASGVHFGTVVTHSGRQVELESARRLWRWDVAPHGVSLNDVAVHGPVGDRSRICCTVPSITLLDALEIIPCTEAAVSVIEAAKVYAP